MPQVGFEPTISVGERPKTYALDRAATGTGTKLIRIIKSFRMGVYGKDVKCVQNVDRKTCREDAISDGES